jgi:hypothetical protein
MLELVGPDYRVQPYMLAAKVVELLRNGMFLPSLERDFCKGDARAHTTRLGNKLREVLVWAEFQLRRAGKPITPQNRWEEACKILRSLINSVCLAFGDEEYFSGVPLYSVRPFI